jgi:ElaB/YqjD/DUF883 family membrane-anchored ribosome-binding protein
MKKHSRSTEHDQRVSDHAKSLIAATSHLTDSKVAEAREKPSEVIDSAKAAVEYVEERAVDTVKQTDEFIREKPYQAVGLAIGIGTLIGFCIARGK